MAGDDGGARGHGSRALDQAGRIAQKTARSVGFWVFIAFVIWAGSTAWLYDQQREHTKHLVDREARIVRQNHVDTCIALNELSRKIFNSLADFDVPAHEREKYRPTRNCEALR